MSAKTAATQLTYRPDIDGLRAIAVLSVLLEHLSVSFAPGGYIGVDVFFVISGYLISALILREMESGSFSILNFYERRIRRILPALTAMLLVVSLLAYHYLTPVGLKDFAKSGLAALFSISNVYFWRQNGYFDAPSLLKPLLHTWSLAVEEQFYLFFPLFLILIRRIFPGKLKIAVWTLALLTFAASSIWVFRNPSTAFYMAPLRAWELLIGTILSQGYLPRIRGAAARNLCSAAGLLLILYCVHFYNAHTVFPGATALAPCLGAGLIIAAGETGSSLVGSLLSSQPMVFLGLISYSLYLWHWPLLVFQDLDSAFTQSQLSPAQLKLFLIALSLAAAILCWWLVETPFRKGRFRPGRKTLFWQAAGATAAITAIFAVFLVSHGLPHRFSPEITRVADYEAYRPGKAWRQGSCHLVLGNNVRQFQPEACLAEDAGKQNYLLMGDSMAANLYPGLTEVFPDIHFSQATASFCVLLVHPPRIDPTYQANCDALAAYMYGKALEQQHFDTVILASFWKESQLPAVGETVKWLHAHGMKVIVMGPQFFYDIPLPELLSVALRQHSNAVLLRHWNSGEESLDAAMARLVTDQWHAQYISAFANLCGRSQEGGGQPFALVSGCPVFAGNEVPIVFDTHHFTPEGSLLYAQTMRARGQMPGGM